MAESVVVVGSINVDLTVSTPRWPNPGETILGGQLSVSPGGKGANQAVAAARCGADVTMIGAVGDDAYDTIALSCLRLSGVNLDGVARVSGATGVAIITVGPHGDNTIIVTPGANGRFDESAVRARADVIGRASVCVLQMEITRAAIRAAAAVTRGRLIVNYAPIIDVDPVVLLSADPLVVNEHEAAAAVGLLQTTGGRTEGAGGVARLDEASMGTAESASTRAGSLRVEANVVESEVVESEVVESGGPGSTQAAAEVSDLRALIKAGVGSAVVTLGERGALVCAGAGQPIIAIPARAVEAVDTTGAGDAFVGSLAAGLAAGLDLVQACHRATDVAAYSVQRPGAQASYPTSSEL
ncbi:MAG: ribokinase [Propionibacteriaceae bacterium]|nr:ribokinase [Propionibacteriaceae bacterium]